MFFIASKIFWFFARPLNLLVFAALAAAVLAWLGWRRLARVLIACVALLVAAFGFTQLPDWLIYRLETAIPAAELPQNPAGIIVLGGGVSANAQAARTGFHLGEAADRIVTGLALKRRYPQARLIYSGGLGSLDRAGRPETAAIGELVAALYGDTRGIELEGESRNTWQNARYVAEMIESPEDSSWLLVTSAFHMPRALAVFRTVGISVLPVPCDYRADPIRFPYVTGETSYQFLKLSIFVKELIGIAAYRATGRIGGPQPAADVSR